MVIVPQVLAFMLTFVGGLLALIMALAYRSVTRYAGPGWWALANLSLALGYACNLLRDIPALHACAVVVNNLLFLGTMFLLHIGVLVFFGRPARLDAQGVWLLAATGVAAFFTVAVPNEAVRIVFFS